jgi:hypothetical protein
MGSAYQCECMGVEWQAYDRTAADGPRRTLCLGILKTVVTIRARGGCDDDPQTTDDSEAGLGRGEMLTVLTGVERSAGHARQ